MSWGQAISAVSLSSPACPPLQIVTASIAALFLSVVSGSPRWFPLRHDNKGWARGTRPGAALEPRPSVASLKSGNESAWEDFRLSVVFVS